MQTLSITSTYFTTYSRDLELFLNCCSSEYGEKKKRKDAVQIYHTLSLLLWFYFRRPMSFICGPLLCVRKAVFACQYTNGFQTNGLSNKSLVICVSYDVLCDKRKMVLHSCVVMYCNCFFVCKHTDNELMAFMFYICLGKSPLSTVIYLICVVCLHAFYLI